MRVEEEGATVASKDGSGMREGLVGRDGIFGFFDRVRVRGWEVSNDKSDWDKF